MTTTSKTKQPKTKRKPRRPATDRPRTLDDVTIKKMGGDRR